MAYPRLPDGKPVLPLQVPGPSTAGRRRPRDVSRSLACALGAVMSNFAMLNVWLSLLIVLLAAIVLRNVVFGESRPGSRPGSLLSCQQETAFVYCRVLAGRALRRPRVFSRSGVVEHAV